MISASTGGWLGGGGTAGVASLHRPPLLQALSGQSASPSAQEGMIFRVRTTLALPPPLSFTCEQQTWRGSGGRGEEGVRRRRHSYKSPLLPLLALLL